jgi:Tol biopolymer transport system component
MSRGPHPRADTFWKGGIVTNNRSPQDGIRRLRGRCSGAFALVILATTLLGLGAAPGPARAAFAGGNGKIVFVSDRDGNPEIYVMNPDGTGQLNLTNNPADDRTPSWSADGTRIAFSSNRSGFFEIYTVRADGSGLRQLTDSPSFNARPAWTADGKQIVFHTDRDGNFEIYRMNADGSGQINLTRDPADDAFPATSAQGKRIVFTSLRSGVVHLYTMNQDGGALQPFAGGPVETDQASWSPRGNQLVFRGADGSTDPDVDLYLALSDGSDLRRLTNTPMRTEFKPSWSPDGSRIVFQGCTTFINGAGYCQLYSIKPDGSDETPFSNPAPSIPAVDDFDGNAADPSLWRSDAPLGTGISATVTNQRLEIAVQPDAQPSPFDPLILAGLRGSCLLHGDYDIQSDFSLLDWPAANGTFLDIVADANGNMGLYGGAPDAYATFFNIPDDATASTTDTSGAFRLVRSGSTLSGYYLHDGAWTLLKSASTTTIDTSYILLAGTYPPAFSRQFVRVAFDNFRIKIGQLNCPIDGRLPDWQPAR